MNKYTQQHINIINALRATTDNDGEVHSVGTIGTIVVIGVWLTFNVILSTIILRLFVKDWLINPVTVLVLAYFLPSIAISLYKTIKTSLIPLLDAHKEKEEGEDILIDVSLDSKIYGTVQVPADMSTNEAITWLVDTEIESLDSDQITALFDSGYLNKPIQESLDELKSLKFMAGSDKINSPILKLTEAH